MAKRKRVRECMDCGECVSKLYDDPSDPTLDTEPCLCAGCFVGHAEQEIEDAEARISELRDEISKVMP